LIRQLEASCNRQPGEVKLLVVSKGHPCSAIEQAYAAGVRDFGESYLQEAQTKIQTLIALPLCWHFIGPIQSNKAASIALNFSWVHSVCRQQIAKLLNDARLPSMPPINVCIQVNLDGEQSKSGVTLDELATLASYALQLPHLRLRGLMLIPKPQTDEKLQYLSFLRLRTLLDKLNQQLNLEMDTLSMGMSNDMQAAIRAGSTIVRIGTTIFGERA
jgi:pyridoxal phosphate enzyme (YggS family)